MQNFAGIFLNSLHEGNPSQVVLISRIREPLALLKKHDPLALISGLWLTSVIREINAFGTPACTALAVYRIHSSCVDLWFGDESHREKVFGLCPALGSGASAG